MEHLDHRKATAEDLPSIMEICGQAKAFLRARGVDQWQDGYPEERDFRQDIEQGACHVFVKDGRVVAMVTLLAEEEPAYREIEGQWLSDGPYAVIHRSAVCDDYRGKGIANHFVALCQQECRKLGLHSLRVDTHEQNRPMRTLLENHGFRRCGIVHYHHAPGLVNRRVAYEKLL